MAVKDVSLDIKKGEIVGFIGPNGAGKTTLLKMIAGLLPVDKGTIEVNGSVTALLALGVGVVPEMTGRENILYGGMLLGMSKNEVRSKMDSIIEFAELNDFVDRPMRTYSSGMRARLLFSISMSIVPDILIVDEALATGDSYFVKKCSRRIREICESGATILFVSHNLRHIKELCDKCYILQAGQLLASGDSESVIAEYISGIIARNDAKLMEELQANVLTSSAGTGEVTISDICFVSANSERVNTLFIGEPYSLNIYAKSVSDFAKVKVALEVRSEKSSGTYAFVPPPLPIFTEAEKLFSLAQGENLIKIDFDSLCIGDGEYSVDVFVFSGEADFVFSIEKSYCHYVDVMKFQATYQNSTYFRRRSLCEIPVRRISACSISLKS